MRINRCCVVLGFTCFLILHNNLTCFDSSDLKPLELGRWSLHFSLNSQPQYNWIWPSLGTFLPYANSAFICSYQTNLAAVFGGRRQNRWALMIFHGNVFAHFFFNNKNKFWLLFFFVCVCVWVGCGLLLLFLWFVICWRKLRNKDAAGLSYL